MKEFGINNQHKEFVVKNLAELKVFAEGFLNQLTSFKSLDIEKNTDIGLISDYKNTALVVGLVGDLGAGKTTFSKIIAELLGIKEIVTSPTFGIQKQYKVENSALFDKFVHIDAYRIEDIKEVGVLRFVELFQKPRTLVFIEWPEKIKEILPKDIVVLSFDSIDENTRKISY